MPLFKSDRRLCVHCLLELETSSKDHVFPRVFYTADTSPTIQRWTVPSCTKCNESFGRLEERLFLRLAACMDPNSPSTAGILDKFNSILVKRKDLRDEILKEIQPLTPDIRHFPNLGPHSDYPMQAHVVINVPVYLIDVLQKVFRGAEYYLNSGRYIEKPFSLRVSHVYAEPIEIAALLRSKFSKTRHLGPGFVLDRISPDVDSGLVIYRSTIWGRFISYGIIDDKLEMESD